MSNYLVTGVAGFIAARVAEMLLEGGHTVVGVDNMNQAYDVRMKRYRLDRLRSQDRFRFHQLDISVRDFLKSFEELNLPRFDGVINLAARAGCAPAWKIPGFILTPMSPAR